MKNLLKDVYGPGDDNYGRNPSQLKELSKEKMDKCIYCGCDTIYSINMHIDYRMHYVEGAGQLCPVCYEQIYTIKNNGTNLANN